ncbi:hypothetical protein F7725_016286 [Dissostichus mawsoni]|uniref:Uncharacterized protein n=1 Tax=Dissostichus mawsoni TaxID=36200 RepID=A0A7J5Z259_DISMA|nr:hypothetical protein F7725_016286 [Dissostichus mawsoni]
MGGGQEGEGWYAAVSSARRSGVGAHLEKPASFWRKITAVPWTARSSQKGGLASKEPLTGQKDRNGLKTHRGLKILQYTGDSNYCNTTHCGSHPLDPKYPSVSGKAELNFERRGETLERNSKLSHQCLEHGNRQRPLQATALVSTAAKQHLKHTPRGTRLWSGTSQSEGHRCSCTCTKLLRDRQGGSVPLHVAVDVSVPLHVAVFAEVTSVDLHHLPFEAQAGHVVLKVQLDAGEGGRGGGQTHREAQSQVNAPQSAAVLHRELVDLGADSLH